jgi:hypothetical protein
MLMLMGSDEVGEEGEEVLVTCATVTATLLSLQNVCEKLYVHLYAAILFLFLDFSYWIV